MDDKHLVMYRRGMFDQFCGVSRICKQLSFISIFKTFENFATFHISVQFKIPSLSFPSSPKRCHIQEGEVPIGACSQCNCVVVCVYIQWVQRLSMYLSPNTVKFTMFEVSIRIFDVAVCFTITPFAYSFNMYVWM